MTAEKLLQVYEQYMRRRGAVERTRRDRRAAAREFLRRFPAPESFCTLSPSAQRRCLTRDMVCFVGYLALEGRIRLSYRQLLSSRWGVTLARALPGTRHEQEVARVRARLKRLGYCETVLIHATSRVLLRMLVRTGKHVGELAATDFDELRATLVSLTGLSCETLQHGLVAAQRALFHEYILDELPPRRTCASGGWEQAIRTDVVQPAMRGVFLRYLGRVGLTLKPDTLSSYNATLRHFSRFLAHRHPQVRRLSQLTRRHIESYMQSMLTPSTEGGVRRAQKASLTLRRRRLGCLRKFFLDVQRWRGRGAPQNLLLLAEDIPRLPRLLPRALSPETDQRLRRAFDQIQDPMAKDALHVLRGCGLRIGELLALRADCLEQDAEGFHWLRVPAHKLDNERNIPLDPETARAVSRLQDLRNDARRTAAQRGNRPVNTDRVLLRHGYPVSENYIRTALYRAADLAGLQPPPGRPRAVVPHQLRHTYATELVNAGIDVPALMDLLGHLSPDMTMHYGRISSRTLRDRYHEAIARLPQALRDAADPGDALRHDDLLRLLRTEHQKVVRELAGGKMTGSPTEGLSGLQELLSRVLAALESRQGRGGKD